MTSSLRKDRKPHLESEVPADLLRSLDSSADDIKNDRVEDTNRFLDGMQRRIDEYFARRRTPGSR